MKQNSTTVVRVDPNKEKLIVSFNMLLKPDVLSKMREDILKQLKEGVVVLPAYCTAIIIDKDDLLEVYGGACVE